MRTDRRHRIAHLSVALLAVTGLVVVRAEGSEAAFSQQTGNAGNTLGSARDWRPPVISAYIALKSEGGTAGYIRPGGTYRLVAAVADDPASNPASGVGSVTGNGSTLTAANTAVPLTATTSSVAGPSYTHQGAALTLSATKAAGSYVITATAADQASPGPFNVSAARSATVVVDGTRPAPAGLTFTNAGVLGRPDLGDTLTFLWSEPIEPHTVLAGWAGAAGNITVRISNGRNGANDVLTVWNDANTTQLPIGTLNLGNTGYVAGNSTFGAPGAAARSTMTWVGDGITVQLGTPSATASQATASTYTWTPTATVLDRAGNGSSTTAYAEPGGSDRDF